MTLGQRIYELRTQYALSQEALGEKLGVSRQTVSKWETDGAYPEIEKIVAMSRLFSVTTDSLLVDGIDTFDCAGDVWICGVYKSSRMEIAETEKFALVFDCNADKSILRTRLYIGFCDEKYLATICERDQTTKTTKYAYRIDAGEVVTNDAAGLALRLGEQYDTTTKRTMRRTERFAVDHESGAMPTVSEAGISKCLLAWRMGNGYFATPDRHHFFMCTGKTEYVFSIWKENTNIYCGASYNIVFDVGVFGGGQFFRIRNEGDNTGAHCRFECDLGYEMPDVSIPTEEVQLGQCVNTSRGMMWCVKRYTDDMIVLQGCGGDEYIYRRKDRHTECFKSV